MFHKKLLLIFLVILPVSLFYFSNGIVNAQIDIEEDDDPETEVEDQPGPDNVVVGQESYLNDEDESEEKPLKPSPDADTTFLFTQPSGITTDLPAGKDVHFLVGFSNRGSKDLTVESMDASFRYPLDFTFHIQNFSVVPYNRVVKPKQDISLYYSFYTSETYSARPFGLVVNLFYKDADGHQYLDAVFNETITIVEVEDSMDGETFFLYVLLIACVVLVVVLFQQFLINFTKKKISSGQKIETGTQNHQSDVDHDWVPREILNDLNKSPGRTSPRKTKSPKQSPKQAAVQRRIKRGGKDE